MALQRGDVVLIPFPYTDLSAAKTRPAIVVSSNIYHRVRPELLLAYVSSQLSNVNPLLDYILTDWKAAGLPKPSFVRPKLAAIEPTLVVHRVVCYRRKIYSKSIIAYVRQWRLQRRRWLM